MTDHHPASAETRFRHEGDTRLGALVWRWAQPMWAIASGPLGGGTGARRWVVNAQVPHDYARADPDNHLREIAAAFGLEGSGVGMLTAADVGALSSAEDGGIEVAATVGLGYPILAAAPPDDDAPDDDGAGTINVVAILPRRVSDAALVNAVVTLTEAKTQALFDAGLHATGTASDAVCILCPTEGPAATFGGPRSYVGSRLARAVHAAVLDGALADRAGR
jgi:adenosylcobinamide hydrolase